MAAEPARRLAGEQEPYRLKELFESADSAREYVRGAADLMVSRLQALDAGAVAKVIDAIETAGQTGRAVYTIGNGGSAVVASHFVNDMCANSFVSGEPGYRVYCLADNVASITAIANDIEFEDVFRRQLECVLQPRDVLVALSVSGNSENVIRAVEFANAYQGVTIGLCGFDGGRLARTAQHVVQVPSTRDEYGPVEDTFSVIFHLVSSYLTMRRGRLLHH